MRSLFLITLLLLFGLLSCKKDKLEGEQSILEGKWEWVYSIKTTFYSNINYTEVDTILPDETSSTYAIEFSRKGKFYLFENNEVKEEHRLVFASFVLEGSPCIGSGFSSDRYYYAIYPDNDMNNHFYGCVNYDSLICNSKDFPFTYSDGPPSIVYSNFFKKVN